jgi:hypothetical protein
VYHNTVEDEIAIEPPNRGDASEIYVRNNIARIYAPVYNLSDPDVVKEFNVFGTGNWGPTNIISDPMIADFDNRDFTLLPGSPAIDHGMFLPGYIGPGDYTGDFPDAGAYEYGVEPWYPGARIRWTDLYTLTLDDNGDGSFSISGFPMGRKPTADFTVRLGESGPVAEVTHWYNTDTHHAEVIVELDASGLPGDTPVFFSLDGHTFVQADQTLGQ